MLKQVENPSDTQEKQGVDKEKKDTILSVEMYYSNTTTIMKNLNYFWRDAKWILFGFLCSLAILIVGACEGVVVDANEVAGVLSVTAYLLLLIYPCRKKTLETILMPMAIASLAVVLSLGWWTWLIVLPLTFFHLYFIENSKGAFLVLDIVVIVTVSLLSCGATHLFYWLFSLI